MSTPPPEHAIRLRGGWQNHTSAGEAVPLSLPTDWPAETRGRLRLVRKFGAPRIDPTQERVVLRLESVAGLRSVVLNTKTLEAGAESETSLEIPLAPEDLATRNVLELAVDADAWVESPQLRRGWGAIALVVKAR